MENLSGRKKKSIVIALTVTAAALALAGAALFSCESAGKPEPVTLQLKWHHQAQFAGFYEAVEKGLYAGEQMTVDLIEGGRDVNISEALVSGRADFAVFSPEGLLKERSRGVPIKAIAAIYRKSAVVFAAKKGSGINRPADFAGKTVAAGGEGGGAWEFLLQLKALMHRMQVDEGSIDIVPYDPAYEGFLKEEVDITPTYYTGGLIKLRLKGVDLNLIWPDDYGIRFYSDILVTTDDLVTRNPERVVRFLNASLAGWRKAVGSPVQTVDTVMNYARIKDRKMQSAMFNAMMPLVHTGRDHIGSMESSVWRDMYDAMASQGLLESRFDVTDAYTLEFLQQLFPEKDE